MNLTSVNESPKEKPSALGVNDDVYVKVNDVKEKMIMVSILKSDSKQRKKAYITNAALFISNITEGFIDKTRTATKIGDILKAKIIKSEAGLVDVSTKGRMYGVVAGYCSKCRSGLRLKKKADYREVEDLTCSKCLNVEKRKISNEYLYLG